MAQVTKVPVSRLVKDGSDDGPAKKSRYDLIHSLAYSPSQEPTGVNAMPMPSVNSQDWTIACDGMGVYSSRKSLSFTPTPPLAFSEEYLPRMPARRVLESFLYGVLFQG